jgi:hypothetical protein
MTLGTDPRPLYFVKMFKDGTYECNLADREELEQSTMELEYIPQPPTENEKIQYALNSEPVKCMVLPDEQKLQIAKMIAGSSGFVIPITFDPNVSRVHEDPEYFFKTPAKPVIWCWKNGSQQEAISEAESYRQKMLSSGKWDKVVTVYKEQYNVVED